MASQINIYSQLSITTIRIADINNSNCRYQQLWILPRHRGEYVIHMVATRGLVLDWRQRCSFSPP